jgi:O-antigen/teichoic acid export membrane protein
MKSLLYSALARVFSLIPAAIATLLASRLIIRHFGLNAFDSYALVVSLIALIPLNNLGVGAAVTSTFAANGTSDERSRRVMLTAARTLSVSTIALAVVTVALMSLNLWPTILGAASGPNLFVGLAMLVYALTFLPGLGQSMLLGVNRNHVAILVQTLLAPITLLIVVAVMVSNVDQRLVIITPTLALLIINLLTSMVAGRATGFSWLRLLRKIPRRRRFPGASIRAISGPMLVVTLTLPLAYYTDRIVLSHFSTKQAVANYSVVLQIFTPVAALIAAAAQPLFPMYAKARSEGRAGPRLGRVISVFCVGSVLAAGLIVLVANPIGHLIGGNNINLGLFIPIACALSVAAQGLAFPLAMSMMDPQGLRFVATCATLAVPTNIGVSILLVKHYGAAGPLLATFSVGLLVQTLPGLVYSRSRHRSARHRYAPGTGFRRAVLPNEPVINASTVTASDPYMALVEEAMSPRPARPLSPFRAWEKDPVKLE